MARGVYTVKADNVTVATQALTTLVFINPGTTATIEIIRAWASQRANATSNQQGVALVTQPTTFPTLTSATPTATSLIDQISKITGGTAGAAGTAGTNASAEGAGAKSYLYEDNFNVLNGWLWVPTPIDTIVMSAGSTSGFGLVFTSQPTTLTNWSFGVEYREW